LTNFDIRLYNIYVMFNVSRFNAVVAAFGLSACGQDVVFKTDEQMYVSNAAYKEQRADMGCQGAGDIRTDNPKRPVDFKSAKRSIYFFEFDSARPNTRPESVQRDIAPYVQPKDGKHYGIRLMGCASRDHGDVQDRHPSDFRLKFPGFRPAQDQETYNYRLTEQRIDSVALEAKKLGVSEIRICRVPMGRNCPASERSVRMDIFEIEVEP